MTPQTIAVVHVLGRAASASAHLENLLELEAYDPRCCDLYKAAKDLRKAIYARQGELIVLGDVGEVTAAEAID